MKKLLVILACWVGVASAQTPVVTNPTFYDDTNVHVPLQFGFPFFGRTFTNSWMHSNGVVSFLDPMAPIPNAPYNPAQWAYCCEGMNLTPSNTQLGPQFNYMIAPLWTDLYPVATSTFRTEGTTTYQRYFWNNIAEISNMNNLNTFSLEIRPTGFIGATYNQINIQNQNVTAGITGDISLGQMQQFYYGRGIPTTGIPNWTVNNTPGDICASNPLSSPTCPGYTEAMCTTNPLYSSTCAGYQQAYFTQQCSANPLYDPYCPGYATAYLNYQCSINPLYATTCQGYEQAYFDQQCSISGLYSTRCPNYQQAYFNDQCSKNGLYSTQCPNYATAYATWLALNTVQSPTTSTNTTTTTTPTQTATTTPTVESSGEIKVAVVADQNVNNVITTTATSASPAQAATATVPLVSTTNTAAETKVVAAVQTKTEEKKDASSSNTSSSSSTSGTTTQTSSDDKKSDQPKTARQELQEKRDAAARARAVEDGKNLANNMGKAADMEQQKAVQNVVIAAMGFTPGFDTYGRVKLPDANGYKPFTVYANQTNVDNRRLGRGLFGATDRLHNDMVESQYNRGN